MIVNQIEEFDPTSNEGTYVVTDSKYEISCFGHMLNYQIGDRVFDNLHAMMSEDVVLSSKKEYRAERISTYEYRLNGLLCNEQTAIKVGEIYIELDSPVPGDITDGSWVSVKTTRIDLW